MSPMAMPRGVSRLPDGASALGDFVLPDSTKGLKE